MHYMKDYIKMNCMKDYTLILEVLRERKSWSVSSHYPAGRAKDK